MKRILSLGMILTVIALALSACKPAAPANKLEEIRQKGKIIVGTSPDYPPFESVDADGKMVGFDIDLINAIGKKMGVEVELVSMPFDSLIAAVQTGKIDVSISAFNYDEDRDKNVDFTIEYYTAKDAFLVADNFSGEITKGEDIAQYKVGAQTGTTQEGWITDELVKKGLMKEDQLFRYDKVDQAALDLKAGRIDVLMGDNLPMQALISSMGGMKIAFEDVITSGPIMMILPEGEAALKAELDKAIDALKGDGTIQTIAKTHFK